MARLSPTRRVAVLACAVGLAAGAAAATPAYAETPEVQLTLSAGTVEAGDTVTVTETVTNVHDFSVLQPTARLFSEPTVLTGYTELVDCTGAVSCSTVDGENGPIGYQAVLPEALSARESATVTFTLRTAQDSPDLQETIQGRLSGQNYGSELVDGPVLRVDGSADVGVRLDVRPRFGLFNGRLEFTVRLTGNGPAVARDVAVTTTLPQGLSATSGNAACVPSAGKVTCTAEEIAAGDSTALGFSVRLGLASIGLPYRFTAARTESSPQDPEAGNDTAAVECTVLTHLLVSCADAPTGSARS
ncbi:DUF11 domain-containing protein [Amycolatopsis cihanbeyliensis]|uniref:Putative repeat protein (TIGR01451 family) n=1 Tax=Amycolatopsis cihanbeyliensis TaxID=1128664 RepID=A0A542CTY8_AMYCI|nr:DUF11 domain-containing protein [Amycolatopsis cihanbeyliensis]TQI94286.1 putative repeat protein (TIGR01451 family) [Amycolatopsis cihanbeyliensis]